MLLMVAICAPTAVGFFAEPLTVQSFTLLYIC
jgi:hypothetical protein